MASSSDDIRKLFRDRKQQQQNSKRIDSPLARYDAAGRLFCTVCRLQIANESNWSSHLIDRSHRQKIEQLKQFKTKTESKLGSSTSAEEVKGSNIDSAVGKRKNEAEAEKPSKHTRLDNPIGLPSDFFDRKSDSDARNVQTEESEKVIDEDVKNLPVGFFDDPKMDSKVQCLRKTVRSKDDEQWNEFQREMAVEQSKLIEPEVDLDDKLEQLQHERDLDEVGEQLEYWKRINELEKKKSEKQLAKPMQIDADENKSQSKSNSETEDDDEGLEEEFTSWRNKPKVRP